MIGILISACVLMALLKTINDEDVGLGTAALLAIGTSVVAAVFAIGFAMILGDIVGLAIALVLNGLLVAVAVSFLFGVEIKRSFLIGGLYMFVNVAIAFATGGFSTE